MTVKLDVRLILTVAPTCPDPTVVVGALLPVIRQYGIDQTPERLGMFLAQWAHESNFECKSENLNYTAERILQIFGNGGRRFQTVAQCRPFAHNPQALANRVYNGRMGNAEGSNDGWTYRGRGWPQLTGRDAYRAYGKAIGQDLEGNPNLLLQSSVSAAVAGAFWHSKRLRNDARNLNQMADNGDMISVTLAINGGRNGLEDRLERYRAVIPLLRAQAAAPPPPVPSAPVVEPVRRLFINGVETDMADVLLGETTLTLRGVLHQITKSTPMGDKLYVQTAQ